MLSLDARAIGAEIKLHRVGKFLSSHFFGDDLVKERDGVKMHEPSEIIATA